MRTNIAFDISIGAITGQADLTNVIAGSVSQGVMGALSGSPLQKVQNQLNSAFSDAYVTGAKAGLGVQNRMFKKQVTSELAAIEHRGKVWQSWQKKISATNDANQRQLMQRQADAVQREIAQRQAGLDRIIRRRENANEHYFDLLQKYEENAARTFSERAEEAGNSFAAVISSAMTLDDLDPSSLVEGMASAFESAAPALASVGGKMAAQGGAVGAIGNAAVALAGSAAVIAGAAAAIGAVVAVFAAAYGQTKEMNSAILEGSTAMDVMSESSVSLAKDLGDIRKAAIETTSVFRMTSDEVVEVLSGLNQAGVTYKAMRESFGTMGEAQESYNNIAATTIVQMKVFGQSVSEIGSIIDFMMDDIGTGMEGINDAFVTMYAGAKLSGRAAADFFTSINEITSGMARMNFRLEDSVEMLLAMTEILGEDLGKEMAQFTGKYKEAGFTDRMKTSMVAGRAGREILAGQTTKQSEELAKVIQESGNAMMLVSRGLGFIGKDGKLQIDTEALGKLTGTQLGALQNALGGVLGTRTGALAELARGSGAGANLGQRAAAMANLDRQGEMAMEMVSAFAVLGNKRIDQMEGLDRAAFEEITGVSGGMFEAYQDISRRIGAQLEEQGKGTGRGGAVTMMDVARAIQEGDLLSDADRATLRESQEAGMAPMEKLARAQLKETTSISTDIKNKIVGLLESVNGFLEAMVDLTDWGGENESTKRAKRKATAARQSSQLAGLSEQLAEEMSAYMKAGGLESSDEYQAMKKRKEDLNTAQAALRKSGYTASGEISKEGGEALARIYGADVSVASLGKAKMHLGYTKMTKVGKMGPHGGYAGATAPEYGVRSEFYQDPKAIEELAKSQGKTLADQMKSTKSTENIQKSTEKSADDIEKLLKLTRDEASERKSFDVIRAALGEEGLQKFKTAYYGKQGIGGYQGQLSGGMAGEAFRYFQGQRRKAGLNDFFYQNGTITPINPNDTLIGVKPRVDGGAGGAGGGNVYNININGGNQAEVYRVVKLATKARGM